MNIKSAEHAAAANNVTRLSDADRALMLAVAEREWAQGKISIEEYQYIQDECRVHPGAALAQRFLRLIGRSGITRFPLGQPGDPALGMLRPSLETIPVSSIVGSVDRAAYLDRRFGPINGGRARLRSIRQAMEAGEAFLPIEVYRLAGACYVIDGHLRVAAALQIGQLYMDGMVTECWPKAVMETGHPLEAARAEFREITGMYAVSFTTPERYRQAFQQIKEHQWYMGERGRVVTLTDAAQDWYRTTYLPVLQQMVAQGSVPLTKPDLAGDRYLALCDLKERMSREHGQDIGFAEVLRVWTARPLRHPRAWFRRQRQEMRSI
jgi:hypothetical protein